MESAIYQVQTGNQFTALSNSILKPKKNSVASPFSVFLPVQKYQPSFQKEKRVLRVKCGKEVSSSSVDKILMENELSLDEEMKELINDDDGIVELLECLERDAIMGDDKGKDPDDYNRRALIFDKSSRVFQALHHLQNNTYL